MKRKNRIQQTWNIVSIESKKIYSRQIIKLNVLSQILISFKIGFVTSSSSSFLPVQSSNFCKFLAGFFFHITFFITSHLHLNLESCCNICFPECSGGQCSRADPPVVWPIPAGREKCIKYKRYNFNLGKIVTNYFSKLTLIKDSALAMICFSQLIF